MASAVTLKTVGNWKRDISVALRDVLNVSMDIGGRTGAEACKHALILMAQSARAIARKAPARRPVIDNPRFTHLLRKPQYKVMRMAGRDMSHYYNYAATKLRQPPKPNREIFANVRSRIAKIGNRGLAKRSWMWGLSKIGGPSTGGRELPGTSKVYSILGDKICGYIKEDRLSYILKAMPAGWDAEVQSRAGNKIMAQAALKIERQWKAAVARGDKRAGRTLASFFIKAA